MAQHAVTKLIDDVDGSDADETVTFGLDGATFEIDLTTEHADALRSSLAEWINHARHLGRANAGKTRPRQAVSDVDPAVVRAWAASTGVEVPARGRVPGRVIELYRASNG